MTIWTTKDDISVGQTLESGPYKGARVLRVSPNGWVRCVWSDGREFSVRVHWLQLKVDLNFDLSRRQLGLR